MATLSKEDKELFNFIINDPQSTEEEKKSAREVLKEFGGESKTSTKKTTPKKTSTKKATTKSSMSDLEKKKAELKKKTGKTLEECEKIIEQYKALKSSDATQKKKETTQKVQAKKRSTKLKKEGKVIKGTTEKNAEATLNTATKKVVKKLDKQVDKIQKTSKTEKQVEQKITSLVTKAVRSNKKLFTDTAKELAKVDKNNAKQYLMSLKKEIDTLLKKYEYGGMLPSNFGQAGLVGETGAMNEVDLFAMGGSLPQGVHQYYAQTYNPAYPTPHGYAKGGMTGNKNSQIISEIEEIKSEITERPPKLYEEDGQIKLSSEEGDEFSDYYGEFYEPMYVDSRLEAIADKYNSFWEWENAGTLVLVQEYAKGGEVSDLKMKLDKLDPKGNTSVSYDQDSKEYYWEDYKNDIYRDGYKSEKDAYNNLIDYLKSYAKGGLVELKSVGSLIDVKKGLIYPQYDNGKADFSNPISLRDEEASSDWYESLSPQDYKVVEKATKSFAKGGKIRVIIADNLDDHRGYKEGTILEVKEIDDDDYMITKEGYYLSEGEVDFADQESANNYYKEINSRYAKGGEVADINKFKKQLISKAKSKGLYENFGQAEVRKLEDKYGYTNNVKEFDNWAMNFDNSQMAKGGAIKSKRKKRKTPMTLAKAIRKDGEKWQDAVKRATIMMKKDK